MAKKLGPFTVWTTDMIAKLEYARANGGIRAAYAALPQLSHQAVSSKYYEPNKLAKRKAKLAGTLVEKPYPIITLRPKERHLCTLPADSVEYIRRRLRFEIARIAGETSVPTEAVRAATIDWAMEETKPKPMTIETETNAVDRAYGETDTSHHFRYRVR